MSIFLVERRMTAIVTGSGRGIGRETAVLLARRGVNVVVCSRTDSEVRSVVEEIEKLTSKATVLGVKCDVSVSSQVNSLIRSTIEKFGSKTIDTLSITLELHLTRDWWIHQSKNGIKR